jgi:PDZ domain-containing protein
MTQRTLAGVLAAPLLIALWIAAIVSPLPYVTFQPGVTVNVLGDFEGHRIIQVSGHKTYPPDGQLRMTTVLVSRPHPTSVNLFELMAAWVSRDDAVYPYDVPYPPGTTEASNKKAGEAEMVSSQHLAAAAAVHELGYQTTGARIAGVEAGTPADGRIEKDDVVVTVDRAPVGGADQLIAAVKAAPEGKPLEIGLLRGGVRRTVMVTPTMQDGSPHIGVKVSPDDAVLPLPFDVTLGVDPDEIGGPSAGLMFSLGIYDELTPGSLTGGGVIAGTGTIDAATEVGGIGGIAQKIAAARDAHAQLFLVPPSNCDEALAARNGDMALAPAATMHDAVSVIKTWVADHDADLPPCVQPTEEAG